MSRCARIVAALLLAILLPLQGWAAACAQICARVAEERHAAMVEAMAHVETPSEEESAMHDHCGKSELGAGKCCQAHVFVAQLPVFSTAIPVATFVRTRYVALWTSFIPEEPSHPPIVSAQVA
jgi:hypothetical protein